MDCSIAVLPEVAAGAQVEYVLSHAVYVGDM